MDHVQTDDQNWQPPRTHARLQEVLQIPSPPLAREKVQHKANAVGEGAGRMATRGPGRALGSTSQKLLAAKLRDQHG
eukprot:2155992-Karenia_brevis.AAC.1